MTDLTSLSLLDSITVRNDEYEKVADKIGASLNKAENSYISAVSKNSDPADILKAEIAYKNSLTVFQGFSEMMNNMFQILNRLVSNIRTN